MAKNIQSYLESARLFAKVMDTQFSVFGIRFGLDTVIGVVPGVGDIVSMTFSFYLLWIGMRIGLPTEKLNDMLRNIIIDAVVGTIPFIGDVVDVFIQANVKNLRILEEFASKVNKVNGSRVVEAEVL